MPKHHKRNRVEANSEPKFLAVDFFCGAGGTTRGLIDAGGYVIAGIDKDVRCKETFVGNNKNLRLDQADVEFLNLDIFPISANYPAGQQHELSEELDVRIAAARKISPDTPLLFAICAPCQPFTRLSRKELTQDRIEGRERDSNLLLEASKFVERFQPEMVLSENVAGIKDPRFGSVWQDFRELLDRCGYVTGSRVVCTSKFGVPQYRKRSILIAVRRDLAKQERFVDLVESELLVPEADPNADVISVKEAIAHFPYMGAGETHAELPNHKTRNLSVLNIKRISSAQPGESNAYLEHTKYGDLSLACHRRVNARLKDRCFSDVYTRMHPDRPSPTITTKCHSISNGRFGHFDTSQNRGISLREAATLQSFPDEYVFYPTNQIEPVARMIGNAVPPKLAKYFANYLLETIDC